MHDMTKLCGVCPILPTPFDENGAVDEESLVRVVGFLIDAGVHGIALFGNASEGFALTGAEKQQIAETVVETNAGRVPLIFGAGGTGIEPMKDSVRWAEKNGAEMLMMMPPYMIKPDAERIYEFYAEAARTTELPIMLQDAPGACGVAIPVETVKRLNDTFDNITHIKAEAPPTFLKARKILDATDGRMTVFGGMNGVTFYEELLSGVTGTMPAGEFPEVLCRVYDAFVAGERDAAREEFCRYLPFMRLGTTPGGMGMAVHKEILRRGGIFETATVRNPYVPATEHLMELVWETLRDRPLLALEYGKNRESRG